MKAELIESSFDFSIRLIELIKYLDNEGREFPLSQRLLNCGNGVGVNLRMAEISGTKSRPSATENSLACAVECGYLLKLMAKTGYLSELQSMPLRDTCNQLINLIIEAKKQ